MQVNPKTSAWIMGAITVMSAVAGMGATAFPDYVPAHLAAEIVQTDAFLLALVGAVATGLHLYSSSDPGPLAPADPPVVKAAIAAAAKSAGAIALGLLLGLALALGSPGPARAATASPFTALLSAIGGWAKGDVVTAIGAATKYSALQDQVGPACLADLQTLATMLADHPLPATLKLATDSEYLILDMAQIDKICANTACSQRTADILRIVNVVKSLPVQVSFQTLCSYATPVSLTLTTAAAAATAN